MHTTFFTLQADRALIPLRDLLPFAFGKREKAHDLYPPSPVPQLAEWEKVPKADEGWCNAEIDGSFAPWP